MRYLSETNRVGVRLQFNQEATFMQCGTSCWPGRSTCSSVLKSTTPGWKGALIGEHQIVLLVPESHRLAQRESVDLRELDGEPFISFDNNCQLRSVTDELFRSLGIQPKIYHGDSPGRHYVRHGGRQSRRRYRSQAPGRDPYNVKVLPIENEIPARKLYIQWNKEQYMPPPPNISGILLSAAA